MRKLQAFKQAAGILTGVLLILYFLRTALGALLEDTAPYSLTREELDAELAHSETNGVETIPKIIHQVYLGWGGLPMPAIWNITRKTCVDMNPDYEHMFWTNDSAYELLQKEYPWFLKTFDNYEYPIQRADSIRYFILNSYGGIYIDLDNGCNRSLDMLLGFPAWMPGTTNHMGLTNHIMGTKKHHRYFQLLIGKLENYDRNWVLPYMTIMNSAGPHFVSMVWSEYLSLPGDKDAVRILEQEEYEGNEWSFFTKAEGGTWHHWDTVTFRWIGQHVPFVAVVCFIGLCGLVAGIWWVVTSLIILAEETIRGVPVSHSRLWRKAD